MRIGWIAYSLFNTGNPGHLEEPWPADEKAMGLLDGIGLPNHGSTQKHAFKELIKQAKLRGW